MKSEVELHVVVVHTLEHQEHDIIMAALKSYVDDDHPARYEVEVINGMLDEMAKASKEADEKRQKVMYAS